MIDRLFVYGTLAPGRPKEYVLSDVPGAWEPALVRGVLRQAGWGAEMGYPGIIPTDAGDEVEGFVFSSEQLSEHWQRLDDFEGEGYVRVQVTAKLRSGDCVQVHIYALRNASANTSADAVAKKQ